MINAVIDRDCSDGSSYFGSLRASTKPSAGDASGLVGATSDGPQPDGSVGQSFYASTSRTVSDDQREITLQGTSPRLVGRTPGCVTLTMSHNTVIDRLDSPAQFPASAPSTPTPPPPPSGGTTAPPPAAPVTIALAPGTRTLSLRTLKVTLQPFDVALTGSARLTGTYAHVLGNAEWKAAAGQPVTLRLKLTTVGKRWVRRHPRATVRLAVSARQPAAALVTKTFRLKLRP
jgi:hypothetical protein